MWRFMEYIIENIMFLSACIVVTMFIIYYFDIMCCCWLYSFTTVSTAAATCCLLAIPEVLRLTILRSFRDSRNQSKAWPLCEGILARIGWMDYDGSGSCWPVAVKVFCFGHEPNPKNDYRNCCCRCVIQLINIRIAQKRKKADWVGLILRGNIPLNLVIGERIERLERR